MVYLLIGVFASLMGSFYNVCIHRIFCGESIVFPPSHCPKCKHPLKVWDLIPVISFVLLGGRCRYCKERISFRYPIVEILTSGAYILLYISFGLSLEMLIYSIFIGILIIVSFIDIEHQIVPNSLVLLGLLLGIFSILIGVTVKPLDGLIGFVIGAGILFLIAVLGKLFMGVEGMGGGDIKLLGMIGLFLGWKMTLMTLLFSIYFGGIFAIILLLSKRKKRGEYIPFGPFISLASFIVLLWGEKILTWYLALYF